MKARRQTGALSAEGEFVVDDLRDVAPVGDRDSVRGRLEAAVRELAEEAGPSGAGEGDGAAAEGARCPCFCCAIQFYSFGLSDFATLMLR